MTPSERIAEIEARVNARAKDFSGVGFGVAVNLMNVAENDRAFLLEQLKKAQASRAEVIEETTGRSDELLRENLLARLATLTAENERYKAALERVVEKCEGVSGNPICPCCFVQRWKRADHRPDCALLAARSALSEKE